MVSHRAASRRSGRPSYLPSSGSRLSSSRRTYRPQNSDKEQGKGRGSYLPAGKKSSAASYLPRSGRRLGARRGILGLELPSTAEVPKASGARSLTSPEPFRSDPSREFFEQLGAQVEAELGIAPEGRAPQTAILAEVPDEVLLDLEEAGQQGELGVSDGQPFTVVL